MVRIAICFGLGKLPAPGTWGSIPGLLIGGLMSLYLDNWGALAALIVLGILSYIAIAITEATWHTHDDKRIVIDEVIGCALAVAFTPPQPSFWLLGFVLFRIFDIAKPGPVGYVDKNIQSSWGTLFDDVIAGILAAICLSILNALTL